MGTITTGTGLMTGIDIQGLVESLMAIEARPVRLLERQMAGLDAERAAFMTLSAKLLSLKLAVTPLRSGVTFRPYEARSSNESVLTATASSSASAGSFSFRVRQMVQTHQLISSGFNDPSRSTVGTGTITVEVGGGRLDKDTELNFLNGHQGVRRGTIRITDRNGSSAEIDLRAMITVSDVLDAINGAEGVNVRANVQGDSIAITDLSGGTSSLLIEDISGGHAAEDLGIAGIDTTGTLVGTDLVALTAQTPFEVLNDGNGVRMNSMGADLQIKLGGAEDWLDIDLGEDLRWETSLDRLNRGQGVRLGEIKITTRDGVATTVDLSDAATIKTIADVRDAITAAADVAVTIIGSHLMISDSTDADGTLKIENGFEGYTASDLGIEGESSAGQSTINGEDIYTFLATLNDVISSINAAAAGQLTAQLSSDSKRLELISQTGFLEVRSFEDSNTAEDLGIARQTSTGGTLTGNRVVSGLNSVLLASLNGGSGIGLGLIEIQDRSGAWGEVDLSGAETLDDVLAAINSAGTVNVRAELNQAGTGIKITDLTGSTAANLRITDINSTAAADLKIAIDGSVDFVDSVNNQVQYISETTLLSELDAGRGISSGSFAITDTAGGQARITLAINLLDEMTVGDLMDRINNESSINVTATINSTGDGILLTDEAGGEGTLAVTAGQGTAARDLRLLGVADEAAPGIIDGSYEYRLDVDGSDTLETVIDRLKEMGAPVSATIINDGSEINAYRLSLTSTISGRAGRLVYNAGDTDLNLFELVEAQDAVIFFGGDDAASPIVASSNTNTFINMIPGLTVEVQGVSDSPVTVSVTQDLDSVVEKVQKFVDDFNGILDLLGDYTKYNKETEEAGILLGDMNVDLIRNRLYSGVRATIKGMGDIQRLSTLGIRIHRGAKLEFDVETFREKYNEDREAIETFFSMFDQKGYNEAHAKGDRAVDLFYAQADMGVAHKLDRMLEVLTRNQGGVLARITEGYDKRKENFTDRIEYLEELLDNKEKRLYRQFYNMELAISQMQGMQAALSSFTPIQPMN